MLINREILSSPDQLADRLEDSVFRYCVFSELSYESGHIDASFLSCEFTRVEWYWGLFNVCVFVGCKFNNCIFSGTSFSDCKFVGCTFVDCRFTLDNMGSDCTFDGTVFYGCTQTNVVGLNSLVACVP